MNALERLASGYASEIIRVRQDLSIAEGQLRDFQARLGKPFPHEQYLSELTELRDKLKAKLSAGGQESGEENWPTAADLAEKIKAIKAANSIEATPQRARQKHMAAEEPITARIRRRQEEMQAAEESHPSSTHSVPAEADPMTFAERILLERRQHGEGQSPE